MKQGIHTPCTTCGKPSGGRWEVGPLSYCSVKCAERAGQNVMDHNRQPMRVGVIPPATPTPYA